MGNEDLARRVLAAFLGDMPAQMAALNRAAAGADAESARRAAHTLKGAAANAGAVQVREVARRMEALGKAGDLGGVRALMPELEAYAKRFHAEAESLGR
jgi:two-component system sensor histidine kinase/response regulator